MTRVSEPHRGPAPEPPPDAIWLTVTQTQSKTQLSRPTVVALIESGRLAAIKVGRHWRISASSLEALIDSHAQR